MRRGSPGDCAEGPEGLCLLPLPLSLSLRHLLSERPARRLPHRGPVPQKAGAQWPRPECWTSHWACDVGRDTWGA